MMSANAVNASDIAQFDSSAVGLSRTTSNGYELRPTSSSIQLASGPQPALLRVCFPSWYWMLPMVPIFQCGTELCLRYGRSVYSLYRITAPLAIPTHFKGVWVCPDKPTLAPMRAIARDDGDLRFRPSCIWQRALSPGIRGSRAERVHSSFDSGFMRRTPHRSCGEGRATHAFSSRPLRHPNH